MRKSEIEQIEESARALAEGSSAEVRSAIKAVIEEVRTIETIKEDEPVCSRPYLFLSLCLAAVIVILLTILDTGITNVTNGIRFAPSGGTATGHANNTTLQKVSGTAITASGGVNFTVTNSSILTAGTGVSAAGGSIVNVDSSSIANNTTAFSTVGSFIRVTRNVIMNNGNNFSISGGTIASAGNNMVAVNGAGVPNGTVTQQ